MAQEASLQSEHVQLASELHDFTFLVRDRLLLPTGSCFLPSTLPLASVWVQRQT